MYVVKIFRKALAGIEARNKIKFTGQAIDDFQRALSEIEAAVETACADDNVTIERIEIICNQTGVIDPALPVIEQVRVLADKYKTANNRLVEMQNQHDSYYEENY